MTKSIRAIPLLLVIVLIVSITSVVSAQSGPASCANDGAVTDAANNPGLVSDCAGLLASRDTLSGSATLNWSADLAVEDWEGVTVGGSPRRVTRLILSRNQLTGSIPGELGGLANLQTLDLSGNQLTGEIPAELGSLTNLEGLDLSGNELTGEIPAELGSLPSLTHLDLSGNQLTGEIPGELGGLANLQALGLGGNRLTGEIPGELGGLANLQALWLSFNQLTGSIPGELGGLTNLEDLNLSGNQLTGEIPAELGGLTNLERLYLYGNQLTGEIPGELGGLANLQTLWLSGNQLTGIPAALGGLTNLEDLNLYGNQLTGEIPGELGGLANLEGLDLSNNQLTGEIPGELGGLANLQTLWLSGNQLTGEIPAELGSLPSLTHLDLSGNQLTGEIPGELGGLANLQALGLGGNRLTGEIPAELGNLTNLEVLALFNNQLTGCIPQNLRRIETNDLSQLGLPFCDMPGAPTIATPIVPGDASLTVAWAVPINTGSSAITAYDLRYIETGAADKSDANWTVLEDVWAAGSGSLQYTLTGLTGGTQYDVQVRAVNAAGPGAWSATVTGTPAPPVAPEAPTGLTARVVSGEAQVNLSWTAPANTGGAPITGYKIEASDDGNTSWTEVDTTTGDRTSYTDVGDDGDGPMFGVGDVRHYRVAAINSVGPGAPSDVAKAEDLVDRYDANGNGMIERSEVIAAINDYLDGVAGITRSGVIRLINLHLDGPSTPHNRPGAPTGLTAAGNGQTRIDLSWTAPSDDGGAAITGYRIEVSANGSTWNDLVANTHNTATSDSHIGLTSGSTRHYRVSAINSAGTGPASNIATGTTDTSSGDQAPDLVVGAPTVSESGRAAGMSFTLTATVRNLGTVASGSTNLRYYRSTDATITTSDTQVGADHVSGLPAFGMSAQSIDLTAPDIPGTYYYGACVDADSDETITTNNCSSAVEVTVGAEPGNPTNQRYSWEGSTTVVSWNAVASADYYNIYYDESFSSNCSLSSSGSPISCEELATNVVGTSYTHTSPDDDENYYWVTGCNSGGCSDIDSNNPARFIDNTGTTPNVFLRAVRVTQDWMPFASTGGWTAAVPLKESAFLKFYEVAIWEETSSVHLYEFPNDYDPSYGLRTGVTAQQKIAYREQFLIRKYTGMPEAWTDARSEFLKAAFIDITSYLVDRHPSSQHHLMYSGHGGPGGRLFAGLLKYDHSYDFLESWNQSLGRPLGVIDMGGPCNKGSFADLDNFCEHSRYFVASDLPNGGYTFDDWTIEKYHETNPETQYHNLLSTNQSLEEALKGRIDLKRKAYEYSRNYMIENRVAQANYLYSCASFLRFSPDFKSFLDETDVDYLISDDLYQFMVDNNAAPSLIQRFNDTFVHKADNKDFFDWSQVSNGMLMP